MSARRDKQMAIRADDATAKEAARQSIDEVKRRLGERGPVWWTDGAPDLNRKMVRNTVYSDWFDSIAVGMDQK